MSVPLKNFLLPRTRDQSLSDQCAVLCVGLAITRQAKVLAVLLARLSDQVTDGIAPDNFEVCLVVQNLADSLVRENGNHAALGDWLLPGVEVGPVDVLENLLILGGHREREVGVDAVLLK